VGKDLVFLEEISSTNDYIKYELSNSCPISGYTVIAGHQNNGRGQGANKWHTEAGKNVIMSVLLRPEEMMMNQLFVLNTFNNNFV